jgi:hypothetical protein
MSKPKTLRYRWIVLTMTVEMLVFTAMNVAVGGTAGLLIIPLFAGFSWWQMGVLMERNDWVNGYWTTEATESDKQTKRRANTKPKSELAKGVEGSNK